MFDSAFQAVAHDVPVPDALTVLSTYQVVAPAEKSVKNNRIPPRTLVTPMVPEDQPKATPAQPTFCSGVVRISIVTSYPVCPRLGCSLPPLGKPLVSFGKREPGSDNGLVMKS